MEFFFESETNPNIQKLPPEEVRILNLTAEPHPDRRRVHVSIEVTPFEKSPHMEVVLLDPLGAEAGVVSIIEPMNWKFEFTLHIRGEAQDGDYSLSTRLFYPPDIDPEDPAPRVPDDEIPDTDRRQITFALP